jgi:hypothetical protein
MSSNIETLKALSNRLSKLLDDPQPGLFTWQKAIYSVLDKISKLHSEEQPATKLSCKGCKTPMIEDCYSCIRNGPFSDNFTA